MQFEHDGHIHPALGIGDGMPRHVGWLGSFFWTGAMNRSSDIAARRKGQSPPFSESTGSARQGLNHNVDQTKRSLHAVAVLDMVHVQPIFTDPRASTGATPK
jgi:hypothetical protein